VRLKIRRSTIENESSPVAPHVSIRPYTDSDHSDLVSLWNRVFPQEPPWNDPALIIRRKLQTQRELLLVAVANGVSLVGAVIAGYDGIRGWIYHLAVAAEKRRLGVATALMREAEARLSELGCPKVNLQVRATNAAVVGFYKALGYIAEDRLSFGKPLQERLRLGKPGQHEAGETARIDTHGSHAGIRAVAICVFEHEQRILVTEAYDVVKRQTFYRPLGGGIYFGETGAEALAREVREEIGAEVTDLRLLGTLENIFTYRGAPGHEIVQVYDGELTDASLYELSAISGTESDGAPLKAIWRSVESFGREQPVYPDGLVDLLQARWQDMTQP
jgi:ribosomal protein S18 acetylase RimI-like enzyme/8-oxo-dGTP pyrophosphatase MutT (NUDIX family)